VKVRIGAFDLHGFVPDHRLQAELRFPRNFTKIDFPAALMRQKVWTPNPSMKRKDRRIDRSDMIHITMCMLSGVREMNRDV
jgi:hypothetical protein